MSVAGPEDRVAERRDGKEVSLGRELLIIMTVALLLSVLVRSFIAQAFFVPSGSMEDTLQIQDRILVSKLSTEFSGVQRGEIVVFSDPSDWLPEPTAPTGVSGMVRDALMWVGILPSDTGKDLVKRVIGIGGDNVMCCDVQERVVVNGVPLNETYLKPGAGTNQVPFDIIVPPDRIFVMGDNRGDSSDSRFHMTEAEGTVPIKNVVGRVVWVIWPVSSWSGAPIPSIFENPKIDQQAGPHPKPTSTAGSTQLPSESPEASGDGAVPEPEAS
ncbi:MAG: signal peptidase I [Actinomycetes bacterium]